MTKRIKPPFVTRYSGLCSPLSSKYLTQQYSDWLRIEERITKRKIKSIKRGFVQ